VRKSPNCDHSHDATLHETAAQKEDYRRTVSSWREKYRHRHGRDVCRAPRWRPKCVESSLSFTGPRTVIRHGLSEQGARMWRSTTAAWAQRLAIPPGSCWGERELSARSTSAPRASRCAQTASRAEDGSEQAGARGLALPLSSGRTRSKKPKVGRAEDVWRVRQRASATNTACRPELAGSSTTTTRESGARILSLMPDTKRTKLPLICANLCSI